MHRDIGSEAAEETMSVSTGWEGLWVVMHRDIGSEAAEETMSVSTGWGGLWVLMHRDIGSVAAEETMSVSTAKLYVWSCSTGWGGLWVLMHRDESGCVGGVHDDSVRMFDGYNKVLVFSVRKLFLMFFIRCTGSKSRKRGLDFSFSNG